MSIVNVPTAPGPFSLSTLPTAGGFTSNPPISGSYINMSNIGCNVNKLLTTPPGITEVDGYKESWKQDDTHIVRVFDVVWTQRQAFVQWILGYSNTLLLPDQPPFLSRTPPKQHPERYWLYATEIEMLEGKGAICNNDSVFALDSSGNLIPGPDGNPIPEPMIAYFDSSTNDDGRARYAVHYNVLPYTVRTDAELAAMAPSQGEMERYVVRDFKYSLSTLPLPGQLKFADDGGPQANQFIPTNAAFLPLMMQELHYTWMYVPDPPYAAIDACIGKVNSLAFDGAKGYPARPPGTCLMQPPIIDRHRTALGKVCWNINYTFLYRPQGWSSFPQTDGMFHPAFYWDPVAKVLTSQPFIQSADFTQLFQVPSPVVYD